MTIKNCHTPTCQAYNDAFWEKKIADNNTGLSHFIVSSAHQEGRIC